MSNTKQAETIKKAAIDYANQFNGHQIDLRASFNAGHNWTIQQGYKSPAECHALIQKALELAAERAFNIWVLGETCHGNDYKQSILNVIELIEI